jgi:hypothetical protein
MENIRINRITENMIRHIQDCRPSVNTFRGLNKWRKSLRHFDLDTSLTNFAFGMRNSGIPHGHMVNHTLRDTYVELLDVLPDDETYPDEVKYKLSPFIEVGWNRPKKKYWKYMRLYLKHLYDTYDTAAIAGDHTFAVWNRDGRVRLAPSKDWWFTPRSMAHRLNAVMGLSWLRFRRDYEHDMPTALFGTEHGKLCHVIAYGKLDDNGLKRTALVPVLAGDIIDTNNWTIHSRLMSGSPEMENITSDLISIPHISRKIMGQFRQAPLSPAVRSAIRSETNSILPDSVTDESTLRDFFRQRRLVISESGVFAL